MGNWFLYLQQSLSTSVRLIPVKHWFHHVSKVLKGLLLLPTWNQAQFPSLDCKDNHSLNFIFYSFDIHYLLLLYLCSYYLHMNFFLSISCTELQRTMLHHILHFEFSQFLSTQSCLSFDLTYYVNTSKKKFYLPFQNAYILSQNVYTFTLIHIFFII